MRRDPTAPELKKPHNVRELTLEQFLTPFLIMAIRELKTDFLQIINSAQSQKLLDYFKIAIPQAGNGYDLTKLNKDQYMQFKYVFVEECNFHEIFIKNRDQKVIKQILNVICMIMCKRVPEGVVTFKTDELAKKIKLLPLPRQYGFENIPIQKNSDKLHPGEKHPSIVEQFKTGIYANAQKGNSGEQAVVRIMIKQKKMTLSEIAEEDKLREHDELDDSIEEKK